MACGNPLAGQPEWLRTVLAGIGDAVLTCDVKGRVTWLNPAAAAFTGLEPIQAQGQPLHTILKIIDQRTGARVEDILAPVIADGASVELSNHFSLIAQDRRPVSIELSASPIRDNAGTLNGAVLVFRGVAGREQAEEALRQSLERLERVLDVQTVGVMFWDLNTGNMIDANDTFLKLMGYSRSQVEARELSWQKLTPPEYMDVSRAEIEKFLATGRVGPYEKEYFCNDGTKKWLLFAGSSLGGNQCVEFCIDISDRKRAEERLRKSESRYQSSLQLTGLLAWATDGHGNVVEDCPTWRKFTGQSYDQIEGAAWADAVHPDDLDRTRRIWGEAINQKTRYETEYRLRGSNGVYRSFLVRGIPLFEPDGSIREWVGTCTDITERKRDEERLRRFYGTDLFALLYWQIDGGVIDVNDKFLEMTGYTRDDLRAGRLNWSQMTPPEYHAMDEDARRQVLETGVHLPYEKEYIRKDGTRIWGLFSAVAWEDNRNEGVSIILDITNRKHAEEALQKSEARFRALFERNHDGVFLTVPGGPILAANAAACAMFGMSQEEICRAGREALEDTDDLGQSAALAERKRKGQLANRELRFVRKSGERFIAEVDFIDLFSDPPRSFMLLHDLTERKLAEQALLRSEKLALQREQLQALAQRIARAREEERTRVSHDLHDQIGQLLTAIKMDLKWISRRVQEPAVIERLKSSMDHLTEGMQSVRTICSGLRPSILDDLGLAAAIEWQVKDFAARTGIHCQTDLVSEKLHLSTDQTTAFFRIFQECLTNISRHSEATLVEVMLFPSDGDLLMEVRDNGRGFDETDVTRSLGILGMRERSRACGGQVQVISSPGEGATIRVRIPLSAHQAELSHAR